MVTPDRRRRATNRTPWSSVIQKRVIRSSVMVIRPDFLCSLNNGTTLPRLPTTFPYRAQEKRVGPSPR